MLWTPSCQLTSPRSITRNRTMTRRTSFRCPIHYSRGHAYLIVSDRPLNSVTAAISIDNFETESRLRGGSPVEASISSPSKQNQMEIDTRHRYQWWWRRWCFDIRWNEAVGSAKPPPPFVLDWMAGEGVPEAEEGVDLHNVYGMQI